MYTIHFQMVCDAEDAFDAEDAPRRRGREWPQVRALPQVGAVAEVVLAVLKALLDAARAKDLHGLLPLHVALSQEALIVTSARCT